MMKTHFTKLLALLLVFSLLLPMSAYAASTYDVTVSLSDVGGGTDSTGTTLSDSMRYVSGSSNLVELLAQFVLAHYEDGDLETEMYLFNSPAMKKRMDAGLKIASQTRSADAWAEYITTMNFSCPYEGDTLHSKLLNYNTSVADLGVGRHVFTYKNLDEGDSKYGVTYTVTVTVTARGSGSDSGSGGSTPSVPDTVVVVDEDGGNVIIDYPQAEAGTEVTATVSPDEGQLLHHIDVRDEDGNQIPVQYDGNGEYSFVVPEGGVTVTPVFRDETTDPQVSGVSRLLNTDDHVAFMQGYTSGDFRPAASITRAQVAAIFYRLLRDQNVEITTSFTDVPESYWAYEEISVLASLDILNGFGENYAPNRPVTRAQFAAICARFAYAVAEGSSRTSFTDVPVSYWAHDEIETAAAYGWIDGYDDGNFQPSASITRAQAAAIVNRMFERLADQEKVDNGYAKDYTDVNNSYWAWYDIQEASDAHDYEDEENFRYEFWLN